MTSKAQLISDNATLRESNDYLKAKLDRFYEEREREDSLLRTLLADMLVLDPALKRFGEDEWDGIYRWDYGRVHQAAEFARGHEALHSIEREPDIEIHLQEAAA